MNITHKTANKITEKRVSIRSTAWAFFHLIEPLYDISNEEHKALVGDNASSFSYCLID